MINTPPSGGRRGERNFSIEGGQDHITLDSSTLLKNIKKKFNFLPFSNCWENVIPVGKEMIP